MNDFFKNIAGMGGLTDQVIASDFLISTKSGVKMTAFALTEAATPELRSALREQLMAEIAAHESISRYMIENELYHPHDFAKQVQVDADLAQISQKLVK